VTSSHVTIGKGNPQDILLVEGNNPQTPVIRAASWPKLIERLTFEVYPGALIDICFCLRDLTFRRRSNADTDFVKTFLMTYRSFSSPDKLLNSLRDRYNENAEVRIMERQVRFSDGSLTIP